MKQKAFNYLINLVPKCELTIRTRNSSIPTFTFTNCRADYLKYSFFSSTLNGWFSLDLNIRNSETISIFKSRLSSLFNQSKEAYAIFLTQNI